jgi:hypothetical protein
MIPNFAIDENLKVEFLLPDPDLDIFVLGVSTLGGTDVLGTVNSFILGVSLLGGTNVLGTDNGLSWQEVGCSVSNADISVGGEIQDSIYFQPSPGSASLTLQSFELDPTVNPYVRAGTKIRVRVQSSEIDRTLFQGFIDTINVTYYPDGLNLIQLQAFDAYKRLVNSTFELFEFPFEIPSFEVLYKIGYESGLGVSALSLPTPFIVIPGFSETNVAISSLINEATQTSLAIVWIDQDTEELVIRGRIPISDFPLPSPEFTIGNNHPPDFYGVDPYHFCLSEINVFSDQDAFYNTLKLTLASDDTQVIVRKDQDSIDFYGESAVDVTLNVLNTFEMNKWADEVFKQKTENLVNQVTTPALDRLGTLTNAAVFTPGSRINVSYAKGGVTIFGAYTIIKVSHRIDVDNWFTTFDVWKEA